MMSSFHCAECKGFIVTALMLLRSRGGGGGVPPPQAYELNKSPGIIGLSRSRAEKNLVQRIIIVFFCVTQVVIREQDQGVIP